MYSGNLYFTHLNIHFAFLVIPSIYPSISAFIPSILFIPSIPSIHPSLPVFIHLCIHFLHSVYFMYSIHFVYFIYSIHLFPSFIYHPCMHAFIHSFYPFHPSFHLILSHLSIHLPVHPLTSFTIHPSL